MKISYLFTLLTLLIFSSANSQEKNKLVFNPITREKLPKEIAFEGKIKDLSQWQDKDGAHIMVTTETGIYASTKFKHENEGLDAELFAYHYLFNTKENKYKLAWKVYDYISDCPVDIEVSFIKNTFQVTDLDHDNTAEVWMMYHKVCHGDVSPYEMKIIMYEGNQKYAMRGENKIQVSETEFIGGDYKLDNAFVKGPEAFQNFAKKLWNKNVLQKFGE